MPVMTWAQDSRPRLLSTTGGGAVAGLSLGELTAAANRGDPRARARLGEKLLAGNDVPKDVPRALVLLEQAARVGVASAAFRIGMLLDDGTVVARDRVRALAYFRAAAAGGEGEAFYNVGVAYAGAHDVKRDYVEGLAWLILATKRGADADGEQTVRERLVKIHRGELIEQAEARAPELEAELAGKSATAQLPPAGPLVWLGDESPAPNTPAASQGRAVPSVRMVLPVSGYQAWSDLPALKDAAGRREPDAMAALGQVLLDGKLAPADQPRALALLEQAAQAGSADAAQLLADLYTKGDRVASDDAKAFAFTLQAARGGCSLAMYNLGALYANGRGTARDYTASLAWFIVAEKQGFSAGAAERNIRAYLERNAPAEVAVAEKRAAAFLLEITAGSSRIAHR